MSRSRRHRERKAELRQARARIDELEAELEEERIRRAELEDELAEARRLEVVRPRPASRLLDPVRFVRSLWP